MGNGRAARAPLRVLLAAVPITPTKPLTPSHLKALLWLDTLYKATALLHDVTYLVDRRSCDATLQTVDFWNYLDRVCPHAQFREVGEDWIGERYVAHHASGGSDHDAVLRQRYAACVLERGFVHPASRRLLEIWQCQYALLGMHDPGLLTSAPFALDESAAVRELQQSGAGLDVRRMGAGVYLDLSDEGLPLRQIISGDGTCNYMFHVLRRLFGLHAAYDRVLLLCDEELALDYELLGRVLARRGTRTERLTLGRVRVQGVVASARHGGMQAHTVERLFSPLFEAFTPEAVRLGARLYFIAGLGKGSGQEFQPSRLRAFVARAEKLLRSCSTVAPERDEALLASLEQRGGGVDPYRFVSLLFARRTPLSTVAFICSVLLS